MPGKGRGATTCPGSRYDKDNTATNCYLLYSDSTLDDNRPDMTVTVSKTIAKAHRFDLSIRPVVALAYE